MPKNNYNYFAGTVRTFTHLSPPMATPSYTPSVLREMMLFNSLDIPPDRDTYATLQASITSASVGDVTITSNCYNTRVLFGRNNSLVLTSLYGGSPAGAVELGREDVVQHAASVADLEAAGLDASNLIQQPQSTVHERAYTCHTSQQHMYT